MAKAACKAIESNVKEWLKGQNNTIKGKFAAEKPANGLVEQDFVARKKNGPTFAHSSVSAQGQNIYFLISFSKPVCPTTTIEALRNSLDFVTLDKIPLPGFDCPPNWEIFPQTPVSSFKDGVKIVSYENGRLHYMIDTKFFSISGHLIGTWFTPGGCNPPPPPGSCFSIEEDIRGIIDVDMPIKFL